MKYLHTMLRISDIEASLRFFCEGLGLKILKRKDYFKDKFTLIFLAAPGDCSGQ
ncbi:VOC family protein [Pseudoalteromonas sp. SR45-5]|uniref:VOC family protein n=1 Tax=Pseudoalteromonas sp. SR45-5 TaxID=2760928 RepID=UPI0015F902D8|nr:VOC family protein [Pseudoalteromonas sp. SR45-5]MBB1354913.1 VOC family protein [Pseudoalteromonas sp. SR45-5]MBB1403060.1 VOC family protein [Pseudoalteromonas sp. SG45-1]